MLSKARTLHSLGIQEERPTVIETKKQVPRRVKNATSVFLVYMLSEILCPF